MSRKKLCWLALPIVVFVAAIVAANIFAVATPAAHAGTGGLQCAQDQATFYGLDNVYHPGEIGFRTSVACDQYTNITVSSCLEKADGFGGWVNPPPSPCAGKGPVDSVQALGHFLWYECTEVTSTDSATYRGRSVYNMAGYGNIGVVAGSTGGRGSRCLGPFLDLVNTH